MDTKWAIEKLTEFIDHQVTPVSNIYTPGDEELRATHAKEELEEAKMWVTVKKILDHISDEFEPGQYDEDAYYNKKLAAELVREHLKTREETGSKLGID